RAGGMRQRDRHGVAVGEATPDALAEPWQAEQPPRRETPDRHDETRPKQPQLPFAPEGAQLLLTRRGRPVAAPARRAPGIAARNRSTVEGAVELVLVHIEPAAPRAARTAAPRPAPLALDPAGRLAEDVGEPARVAVDDR